jgi:hypothetical protein
MAAAVPGDELSTLESKRLLDPIDRISEILFGLLMAVTIVGSLSIATAGRDEVRTVLVGALGCNLAWGLVDAVMYLVRQLTEKTRRHVLVRQLQSADSATAHRIIAHALPAGVAPLVGPAEIEVLDEVRLDVDKIVAGDRPLVQRLHRVVARLAPLGGELSAFGQGVHGAAFLRGLRACPAG